MHKVYIYIRVWGGGGDKPRFRTALWGLFFALPRNDKQFNNITRGKFLFPERDNGGHLRESCRSTGEWTVYRRTALVTPTTLTSWLADATCTEIIFDQRWLPSNFVIWTMTNILIPGWVVRKCFNDMVSTVRLCNVKEARKVILNEGSVRIWKEKFVIYLRNYFKMRLKKSETRCKTLV
jgi:hypothetical protein